MSSPTAETPDPSADAPDLSGDARLSGDADLSGNAQARIGRYRLEEVIGTGPFTTVHRAYDQRLGDTVAIRILDDDHSQDPESRESFAAEGRALRQVASPHVVRVHDMGETDNHQPYLVMEYADRGTLAQRVAEWAGPDGTAHATTRADILLVARSLAEATRALHRVDLVHRDLSPTNILVRATPGSRKAPAPGSAAALTTGEMPRLDESMVSGGAAAVPVVQVGVPLVQPDEQLAVADLGLVKDLAVQARVPPEAASGSLEGGGFRPPEQRGASGRVDTRSDLWALSALLVWLITGAPPGDDPDQVAPALATKGFTRPLADALARSLATEPEDRHPDVAAWLEDVESALARPSSSPKGEDGEVEPTSEQTASASGAAASGAAAAPLETVVRPTPPWRSRLPIPAGWGGADRFRRPPPPPPASMTAPPPRRRRRTLVRVLLILLVGVAGGVAAMVYLDGDDGDDGDGGNGTVTRTGAGEVMVSESVGDATLSIVGPDSVTVGALASFKAEVDGVEDWVWIMPDGTLLVSEPTVSMRPGSPGQATVTLLGITDSGERLEVRHEVSSVE